jgi:hypothetical protein
MQDSEQNVQRVKNARWSTSTSSKQERMNDANSHCGMRVIEQVPAKEECRRYKDSKYPLKEAINSIMRRDYSCESTVWDEFPLWDQCPNEKG